MNQRVSTSISLLAIVAILSMCIATTADELWAQGGAEQADATTVILLRHADEAGNTGNVGLSPPGEERARVLAQVFGSSGLAALYGVTFKDNNLRVEQTLAPIASALDLKPTILLEGNPIEKFVQEIRAQHSGQTVLVVSHGGTVEEIIKKLGGDDTRCSTKEGYDNLCVVTLCRTCKPHVLRLKYGAIR